MTQCRSARAILDAYRARCVERDLDPATGLPRVFAWLPERQQPNGRAWWCDPSLMDAGECQSTTEREAMHNLAAETRRLTGQQSPRLTTLDAMGLVREVMAEMAAERMVQQVLPLRELHARRGVEVVTIEGVRLEVDKKTA